MYNLKTLVQLLTIINVQSYTGNKTTIRETKIKLLLKLISIGNNITKVKITHMYVWFKIGHKKCRNLVRFHVYVYKTNVFNIMIR